MIIRKLDPSVCCAMCDWTIWRSEAAELWNENGCTLLCRWCAWRWEQWGMW